jgi:hypothetical protein
VQTGDAHAALAINEPALTHDQLAGRCGAHSGGSIKLLRNALLTVVAAVSVLGVVAPATAQAAPCAVAASQGDRHHCRHHHGHHHGRCHHQGVDAGGDAMATSVASLTARIGG